MLERPEIRDKADFRRRMNDLLTIDPARTVVLTIDMQNDYLDTERGTCPVSAADAERVVSSSRILLDLARERGMPVIHTYVARRPIEAEWGFKGAVYGEAGRLARLTQNDQAPARTRPSRFAGTHEAQVPSVLVADGDLHVTSKRVTDAYHDTELDMLLARVFRPEAVVLTGINTDTCVYASTFSTACRGYRPIVISDCVASSRGADSHWMALQLMSRSVAWVMTLDEFSAKVGAAAPEPAAVTTG